MAPDSLPREFWIPARRPAPAWLARVDAMRRATVCGLLGLACLVLGGCSTVAYLAQAAQGQAAVLENARPIAELLAAPETDPALADKLRLAQRLRVFGIQVLHLPDNASYTRYSDVGRPYVLWNVVATPALSLQPVESCFPIAGCLQYRGYYAEDEAQRHAQSLRAQGLDVFWYGVPAYSTLGWFDDPLLNTTLRYGELDLARLIFHELAHQLVYVRDDSSFNEAFATAVELEGVERWLAAQPDPAQRTAHAETEARRAEFRALMQAGRAQLADLYATSLPDADKHTRKVVILQGLRQHYLALRQRWGGFGGYDGWFDAGEHLSGNASNPAPKHLPGSSPNNAHFASQATYHDKVPAFRWLFARSGRDFPLFYRRVRALAALPKAVRNAALLQGNELALNVLLAESEPEPGPEKEQTP